MARERNYSVDLLRIVAMLMIVTLHFLGKGHVLSAYPESSLPYNISWVIESICLVAVNCYVLISGYFLISSRFRLKKFIALAFQVVFYSLGIYLILTFLGKIQPTPLDTVRVILPTLSGVYWFVSAYMAMYLLSPFLNKLILGLEKKEHLSLVLLLIAIFSAWPTFFVFASPSVYDQISISHGYSLTWFIVLYFIAAYLGRYYKPDYKVIRHLQRYAIVATIVAVSFIATRYLGSKLSSSHLSTFSSCLHAYNSLAILASSLALFMVFLNFNIKNRIINKLIMVMAPLTFGVYLIHMGPHVDTLLWSFVNPVAHAGNAWFILFGASVVVTIYLICSAIDYARALVFKRLGNTQFMQRAGNVIESSLVKVWRYCAKITEKLAQ